MDLSPIGATLLINNLIDKEVFMKTCIKCNKTKLLSDFHNDKKRKDGKFPYCRSCRGCEKRSRQERLKHSNGYILLYCKGHKFADKRGYAYEHKIFLLNKIGDGEHKCELCGCFWNWRAYLDHVDHIDSDKSNNSPSNLRPLCNSCNVKKENR